MKRVIYKSIIITLILIEIPFMYLTFKTLDNFKHKDDSIEEVTIDNTFNNRDSNLAIMIQNEQPNDDGSYSYHEAENRNAWPSSETHGFIGAECTDSDGTKIDSSKILTFHLPEFKATIKTKNSIYCTLYFAKGKPALEAMHATSGTTLGGGENGTTAVDGLIRYKGTKDEVTNNYVCFGTTDREKCISESNTYMYRIMGITDGSTTNTNLGLTEGQLKIIKATKYSSSPWLSGVSRDQDWDSSVLANSLNGTFLNTIKNGENGTFWDSLITNHKWYKYKSNIGSASEVTSNLSSNHKVGLMYQSDYRNAGENNSTNWLLISNRYTGSVTDSEWTMSRGDAYFNTSTTTYYYAWYVSSSGSLTCPSDCWKCIYLGNTLSFSPVFYLTQANLIGTGKSDDPFIIAGVMPS